MTGRVTDEAGRPLAGAAVTTLAPLFVRKRAVTDADGEYWLRGCEARLATFVVSAPGRAIDVKQLEIKAVMTPVDFQMKPGGTLRIRVIDEHGQPIPNAQLALPEWRHYDLYWLDLFDRQTDSRGIWELREAPFDKIKADLYYPGRTRLNGLSLVARKEEYVFRLLPAPAVSGTVIDKETKRPIEQFHVVSGMGFRGRQFHWSWYPGMAGFDGRYRILRSPIGPENRVSQFLHIEADGYQPAVSREIQRGEGNVAIDFHLAKSDDVEAIVDTPNGRPAAGAKVALCVPHDSIIEITNGEIVARPLTRWLQETDSAGHFHFPPQRPGDYLVITHDSGFVIFQPLNHKANRRIITLNPWVR